MWQTKGRREKSGMTMNKRFVINIFDFYAPTEWFFLLENHLISAMNPWTFGLLLPSWILTTALNVSRPLPEKGWNSLGERYLKSSCTQKGQRYTMCSTPKNPINHILWPYMLTPHRIEKKHKYKHEHKLYHNLNLVHKLK